MSIVHVSTNRNSGLTIDESGDRFIVDQGVTVHDPDTAIDLSDTATDDSVEIRGVARCEENTILDQGVGCIILVARTGGLIRGRRDLFGAWRRDHRPRRAGSIDRRGHDDRNIGQQ
jgi:hypothetical protein